MLEASGVMLIEIVRDEVAIFVVLIFNRMI